MTDSETYLAQVKADLITTGQALDSLSVEDLAPVDQFHVRGLAAIEDLVASSGIKAPCQARSRSSKFTLQSQNEPRSFHTGSCGFCSRGVLDGGLYPADPLDRSDAVARSRYAAT